MNDIPPGLTYSKKLLQKMKLLAKLILKNIRIKQFQRNTVAWLYLGTVIVF